MPRLAKARSSFHPPEVRLISFLQNVYNTDPSWNVLTPLLKWNKVQPAFRSPNLIRLEWAMMNLRGNLTWCSFPVEVYRIDISHNKLQGEVSLGNVGNELLEAKLEHNEFSSELDLTSLPSNLNYFTVNDNFLNGILDLASLPASLARLHLNQNYFMGVVDVSFLPTFIRVDLRGNKVLVFPEDTSESAWPSILHDHMDEISKPQHYFGCATLITLLAFPFLFD